MTVYSGRWPWPVAECDHAAHLRVKANEVRDAVGLVRRIPEYCRGCGYTFESTT